MNRLWVFAVLAALVAANGAWATSIDCTINDSIGSATTGWYKGTTAQTTDPSAPDYEDQEVEPGMMTGQKWDLEAVLWAADTQTLTLVGGYNFVAGADSWTSGDVFLADNNGAPLYGSSVPNHSTWNPTNSTTTTYDFGYNYALDVNWAGGTFSLVEMVPGVTMELTVYNGQNTNNGSNPWRLAAQDTDTTDDVAFTSGSFSNGSTIFNGAVVGLTGGTHYWVSFDLSDLGQFSDYLAEPGNSLYTHFTMGCGNDTLMGYIPDAPIPEPVSVIMLGCLGAGIVAARRAKKAAK